MHGVICAGVILSVMGAAFFFYVLCAPHPWPVCLVCAGTDWLVPKSPVAFHTLGLGLLPVCITPSTPPLTCASTCAELGHELILKAEVANHAPFFWPWRIIRIGVWMAWTRSLHWPRHGLW